ncbi:hypothetical protein ACFWOB_25415 [Streptomyces sp. NPDC058420]|uniref:hypothetical protein n=1 Tax=Streptomyces sp. NPDC058420 TaxID=3346489 RepID=UPI00364DD472
MTRDSLLADSDVNACARAEAEHPETARGFLAPRPGDVPVAEAAPSSMNILASEVAPGSEPALVPSTAPSPVDALAPRTTPSTGNTLAPKSTPSPGNVLVLEPTPNPRGGPVPETAPGFGFPAPEAVEIQVSEGAGTPMPAAGGTPMPPPRKYAQILEGTEVCRRLVLVARTA